MRSFCVSVLPLLALSLVACGSAPDTSADTTEDLKGPGKLATDQRVPELNGDPTIVHTSKIDMASAIANAQSKGPIIEAKFEIGDDKNLSLSLYPVKDIALDSERNVFQEVSYNPTQLHSKQNLDTFTDQEHLTRSSRDLTLIQLSSKTLADAALDWSWQGSVYWAIPTIRKGRAGYGVYVLDCNDTTRWHFVDGEGASFRTS